jgi:hypothetical protein
VAAIELIPSPENFPRLATLLMVNSIIESTISEGVRMLTAIIPKVTSTTRENTFLDYDNLRAGLIRSDDNAGWPFEDEYFSAKNSMFYNNIRITVRDMTGNTRTPLQGEFRHNRTESLRNFIAKEWNR